jgi:hypothetical protein
MQFHRHTAGADGRRRVVVQSHRSRKVRYALRSVTRVPGLAISNFHGSADVNFVVYRPGGRRCGKKEQISLSRFFPSTMLVDSINPSTIRARTCRAPPLASVCDGHVVDHIAHPGRTPGRMPRQVTF